MSIEHRKLTRIQVKLEAGVKLSLAAISVRPSSLSKYGCQYGEFQTSKAGTTTHTSMLLIVTSAEGLVGKTTTETAVRAAMTKATVVKKPKTFCALTKVVCILVKHTSKAGDEWERRAVAGGDGRWMREWEEAY